MKKMRKGVVKMLVSGALCLAVSTGVFGNGFVSKAAEGDGKTIDMYLIAGQSNAAGFSEMMDVSGTFENVWYAGEANHHVNGVIDSYSWIDKEDWKDCVTTGYGSRYDRIGPEFGMAAVLNDMYAGSDTKAMIFKSAEGGTKLIHDETSGSVISYGSWAPPSTWEEGYKPMWTENGTLDSQYLKGGLYQLFMNNFTTVYNQLIADGYTVNIKGLVWQQGESDIAYADVYKPLLKALITDMREDLGEITGADLSYMPFVIGEIATTFQGEFHADNGYVNKYAAEFIEMQQEVANEMEQVQTVESSDFTLVTPEGSTYGTDTSHYNGHDMVELGNRFGEALVDMNSIQLNDFTMLGAGVRVKTEDTDTTGDGIRYAVGIKKTVWENVQDKNIHVLVMPQRLISGELEKGEKFTSGTSSASAIDATIGGTWEEITVRGVPYMRNYIYLYNIPESFYALPITGRAYYEADNDVIYSPEVTRSFAYVADAAVKDNAWNGDKVALDKYLPRYTVTFSKDGATKETQTVKYGQKAVKPTADWISGDGLTVDRWLADGAIWHFNRPVCQNLNLTPLMMIGGDNENFDVLSGGYKFSDDQSKLITLRSGRVLVNEKVAMLPNRVAGTEINYSINFSMKTPADTNMKGLQDHKDGSDKGFMFGYDENDGSYWMFAFRYRNPGNDGSAEGFYPYIRKINSTGGFESEVWGMSPYRELESGGWYDYRIHVTEQDDGTTISVQFKASNEEEWVQLVTPKKFTYQATGRRLGFLATGPMEYGTNVVVKVANDGEYGFSWKDEWSDALGGLLGSN